MKALITLTIFKEEVGIAIKEYIRKNGYEVVGSLSFELETRHEGYGEDAFVSKFFKECKAEVTPVQKRPFPEPTVKVNQL